MIDSQPMTFFERHGRWGFPLLIALLCLAAYANSFHGAYVFDDLDSITNNQSIRHLWPLWPVLMPPWTEETFMTVSGRPLINLSLALNYAVHGEDVVGYHVVNLLIHVLAAWTLFGFCRRTLLLPRLGEKINAHATTLAGIVAMLWALHPLQTESVTYVVQRAESIAGLFYLLTLYCLCRSATAPRPAAWSVLTVTCCLLGMASKETMATAPIVALVYDRLLLSDSFREILRRRWKLYAGCFASLGLLAALMISSGGRAGTAGTVEGLTAWEYARSQFGVIAHYLRLCFWPDKLALDYGWPIADWPGWQTISRFLTGASLPKENKEVLLKSVNQIFLPALLILALLAGTVLLLLRKHKEAAMLGAWFFIILAPSSSIVPITDLAFEHRMYLALAAVVAAVVLAAFYLLGRLHSAPARRAVGIALVSVD